MPSPSQGQNVAHDRARAQSYYPAGQREQQHESGGDGDSHQQRPAELGDERRFLFVRADSEIEAHVGGQHGESTGVEGGGDSRSEGEAERRDYAEAGQEGAGTAGEGFDEQVYVVRAAVAPYQQRAENRDGDSSQRHRARNENATRVPGKCISV